MNSFYKIIALLAIISIVIRLGLYFVKVQSNLADILSALASLFLVAASLLYLAQTLNQKIPNK
jgi:hypothetical protein